MMHENPAGENTVDTWKLWKIRLTGFCHVLVSL